MAEQYPVDRRSYYDQLKEGLSRLYEDPSGRAMHQLAGMFTDPTASAIPVMGFRVPNEMGQAVAGVLKSAVNEMDRVRQAGGHVPAHFIDPKVYQQAASPNLMNRAASSGGSAISPGAIDELVNFHRTPDRATTELVSRLIANEAMKDFARGNKATLVRALRDMNQSLGTKFTGLGFGK